MVEGPLVIGEWVRSNITKMGSAIRDFTCTIHIILPTCPCGAIRLTIYALKNFVADGQISANHQADGDISGINRPTMEYTRKSAMTIMVFVVHYRHFRVRNDQNSVQLNALTAM